MDRHTIANMGAELGATTTVFPADAQVRSFLRAELREDDFVEVTADEDCGYDLTEEIDLSTLEPLIANCGYENAAGFKLAAFPFYLPKTRSHFDTLF